MIHCVNYAFTITWQMKYYSATTMCWKRLAYSGDGVGRINSSIQHNTTLKLECGPMPNMMVALPNIGGALCSTPQNLVGAQYRVPCSNAAKTRNPFKFAGVPQTRQQISAVSRPKFTILWEHVEEVWVFNKFFPIVGTYASAAKIQPDKVARWCQNGDICVL